MAIRKPTPPAPKSEAMAELLAGSMGQSETIKPGKIVDGTIKVVKGNDVFIDIGYKSEGKVDLSEFSDPAAAKPGEKVQVLVRELENDKTGMVSLSKKAADIQIRWEKVLAQYTEGCVVSGTIQSQVHGGLLVDIDGVEAFLPGSQVDVSPVRDLTVYIGQTFEFKVIKISNERKNIIVSRRELIEGTMAEKRAELLASLQKGEVRKGRVKNITDFGAFIDLDGIDGLLHITDMSWGRIKHPSEMLKVGQELEVMVLDVDREIAPGIEGLVHISEFSWTKRVARPSDMLNIGDEVLVSVLQVDAENQKIALGIRQTQENPWDTVQDRYPVGSRVKGKVRNFTNYGAFIELEEGIDGMIHISDMSWTRKINRPSECLNKGDEVEAIVESVDPKEQRISLSLKKAQTDPWSEIATKYPVGKLVKGKVSKIASFGAFIELEDGVDGLVHISQISDERVTHVKDVLKEGQEVEARVVKVDRKDRRIGLSMTAVNMTEEQVKALEAESEPASGSTSSSSGDMDFGSLGAAFDDAFQSQSVEWQPGESDK